jgi:hypothetical protein
MRIQIALVFFSQLIDEQSVLNGFTTKKVKAFFKPSQATKQWWLYCQELIRSLEIRIIQSADFFCG